MEQHFVEEPCQEGWHRPVLSLFAKLFTVFSCKLPKVTCFQKRACRMAGRTGSSCKQRRAGSSRWGTPCCTYRYRMWIFAGCVRVGAPCFCFALNLLTHGAQPHSTEEYRSFFLKNKLPQRNPLKGLSGKLL